MKRYGLPLYLGLLHGLNDALAGCLLAGYTITAGVPGDVVYAFLGYGLLAFGGQLPAGWILDRFRRLDMALMMSVWLLVLSVLASVFNMPAAILLSGIASALVHVSGGALCFLQEPQRMTGQGIFNAPGVIGLVLGGLAGHQGYGVYLPGLLPVLLVFLLLLHRLDLPDHRRVEEGVGKPLLEAHDYLMLVLLLAIATRSLLWNVFYLLAEQRGGMWLPGIGIAAFSGKIFGGWIADRMNWKLYTFGSLALSAALLARGIGSPVVFFAGIFLLQSVVPIALWAMQQFLWGQQAAATALCLGTAIFLAGLPAYLPDFRELYADKTLLHATFVALLLLNGIWLGANRFSRKA